MSFRIKPVRGDSGQEELVGSDSESSVTFDVWATTSAERTASTYIANAITYFVANAPPVILGKPFKSFNWREDEDTGHLLFDTHYSFRQTPESDIKWSFDTMGGTIKITNSRSTTSYPTGAPDHKNAIEVDADGEVNGTEVVIPALKLTARRRFSSASAVYGPTNFMTFIKTMARHTGKTNTSPYLDFAAQELLFLGATGEFQPGKDNEVEFHFAASENASALSIGGITSVAKNGHDFLWISYEHNLTGTLKSRRPKWVYVERIYDTFEFSELFG